MWVFAPGGEPHVRNERFQKFIAEAVTLLQRLSSLKVSQISLGLLVLMILVISFMWCLWKLRVSGHNELWLLKKSVHSWMSFSTSAQPQYCSACRQLICGFWIFRNTGWECSVCGRTAHMRCLGACDNFDCKCPSQSDPLRHQLVQGNLASDSVCCVCGIICSSPFGLHGLRCLWCGRTIHEKCLRHLPELCDLGPFQKLVLPPSVVRLSLMPTASSSTPPALSSLRSLLTATKKSMTFTHRGSADYRPSTPSPTLTNPTFSSTRENNKYFIRYPKGPSFANFSSSAQRYVRVMGVQLKEGLSQMQIAMATGLSEGLKEVSGDVQHLNQRLSQGFRRPVSKPQNDAANGASLRQQTCCSDERTFVGQPEMNCPLQQTAVVTPSRACPLKGSDLLRESNHVPAVCDNESQSLFESTGVTPTYDNTDAIPDTVTSAPLETPVNNTSSPEVSDPCSRETADFYLKTNVLTSSYGSNIVPLGSTTPLTNTGQQSEDHSSLSLGDARIPCRITRRSSPALLNQSADGPMPHASNGDHFTPLIYTAQRSTFRRSKTSQRPVSSTLAFPYPRIRRRQRLREQRLTDVARAVAVAAQDEDDQRFSDRMHELARVVPAKADAWELHLGVPQVMPRKTAKHLLNLSKPFTKYTSEPAAIESSQREEQQHHNSGQPFTSGRSMSSRKQHSVQRPVLPSSHGKSMGQPATTLSASTLLGSGTETASVSLLQVPPALRGRRPLLVFVNAKSGGQSGSHLLREFYKHLNPMQVVDIQSDGGPQRALTIFKGLAQLNRLRVLVCGGDGTVGWVIDEIQKLYGPPSRCHVPVGILPLGTGNDLAHVLGWGNDFDGDVPRFLAKVELAQTRLLDLWNIKVIGQHNEGQEPETLFETSFNNYVDIGVAARIALKFHQLREAHPELFQSRLGNKFLYGEMGVREWVTEKTVNLGNLRIWCDGLPVVLPEKQIEGLIIVNIPSFSGGVDLWSYDEDEYSYDPVPCERREDSFSASSCYRPGMDKNHNASPFRLVKESQCKPHCYRSALRCSYGYRLYDSHSFSARMSSTPDNHCPRHREHTLSFFSMRPRRSRSSHVWRRSSHKKGQHVPVSRLSHSFSPGHYRRSTQKGISQCPLGVLSRQSSTPALGSSVKRQSVDQPESRSAGYDTTSNLITSSDPYFYTTINQRASALPRKDSAAQPTHLGSCKPTAANDTSQSLCDSSINGVQQKASYYGFSGRPLLCSRRKPTSLTTCKDDSTASPSVDPMQFSHVTLLQQHRTPDESCRRRRRWQKQSIRDELIEVVAVRSLFHLGQVQVGLAEPLRVCQGRNIKLEIPVDVPLQINGEPQMVRPCTIEISYKGESFVLSPTQSHSDVVMDTVAEVLDSAVLSSVLTSAQRNILLRELSKRF